MDEPRSMDGRMTLLDLAAMVAGYGLAGLLLKVFWPESREVSGPVAVVLVIAFAWLGLAMSGPVLLLLRRLTTSGGRGQSWAELAWVMIGSYWIGMLAIVAPVSPSGTATSPVLGVLPIAAALAYRWLGPRVAAPAPGDPTAWTRHAAVGLIVTWPLAWGCLLLLTKTLY